jgi:hypothetical protein
MTTKNIVLALKAGLTIIKCEYIDIYRIDCNNVDCIMCPFAGVTLYSCEIAEDHYITNDQYQQIFKTHSELLI